VHTFTRFSDVGREVAVARIYGGMHNHHSMVDVKETEQRKAKFSIVKTLGTIGPWKLPVCP
jgi:hypothetical protein